MAEETPTIIEQLKDSISDLEYISLISKYGHPMKVPHDALELASLTALYENRDEEVEIEFSCLIWHVFSMKSTSLESSFGSNAYDGFDWGRDGSVNWIKTNNIFITVVGKNTESTELPAKLLEALTHWHPHPHKLLLAKLRHQMDEQGFSIANMVVSKRYVQASWLKELLSANPETIQTQAWNDLKKHWEELAYTTKEQMLDFITRMLSNLLNEKSQNDVLQSFTDGGVLSDEKKYSYSCQLFQLFNTC